MTRAVPCTAVVWALASFGCYASVGPVVGYATGRGVTMGWEAGGGLPLAHVNIGQAFRPQPDKISPTEAEAASGSAEVVLPTSGEIPKTTPQLGGTEIVHYAVFEPWYYVGGTAGLAYEESAGFTTVWGGWASLPANGITLAAEGFDYDSYGVDGAFLPFSIVNCSGARFAGYGASISAGYRWLSGAHEIFLAPKFFAVHCGSLPD